MKRCVIKKKFCFYILLALSIWLYLFYQSINENLSLITTSSQTFNCSLLDPSSQFKIRLDGQEYPKMVPLFYNKSINMDCLKQVSAQSKPKTILMWNKFRMQPQNPYSFGVGAAFKILNCPITNCELTNDRTKLDKSTLVLFHLRNEIDALPSYRPAGQRWTHVVIESPVHCHKCYDKQYENIFNYTAYFTRDSDFTPFYWSDSGIYWEENVDFDTEQDFAANKTMFSATLVSQCKVVSLRDKYITEMKKIIPVDVYGKCGMKCPVDDCRKFIGANYKFFFSFENSVCRDYITEKLYETLRHDIVPVVLGGGDYEYYIPKSGFVNARDYKSPIELANYLIYLDANTTAYNEYFKWKKYIKHDLNHPKLPYLCEMCMQLHLEEYMETKIQKKKTVGPSSLQTLYGLKENCMGGSTTKYILDNQTSLIFNYLARNSLKPSYMMSHEAFDYLINKSDKPVS